MDISDRISKGEGQITEFKKSLSLKKEALESLCAMVNADCAEGLVIFGIGQDGTICGVDPGNLDKAQRSLTQTINNSFDPPLQAEINLVNLTGINLMLLSARRLKSIPYHEYDGRAWIRQGSDKRILTVSEKDHLRKNRDRAFHPGPWQCDRCKSWVGILSNCTITNEGAKKDYDCDCGGEFWPV